MGHSPEHSTDSSKLHRFHAYACYRSKAKGFAALRHLHSRIPQSGFPAWFWEASGTSMTFKFIVAHDSLIQDNPLNIH